VDQSPPAILDASAQQGNAPGRGPRTPSPVGLHPLAAALGRETGELEDEKEEEGRAVDPPGASRTAWMVALGLVPEAVPGTSRSLGGDDGGTGVVGKEAPLLPLPSGDESADDVLFLRRACLEMVTTEI